MFLLVVMGRHGPLLHVIRHDKARYFFTCTDMSATSLIQEKVGAEHMHYDISMESEALDWYGGIISNGCLYII